MMTEGPDSPQVHASQPWQDSPDSTPHPPPRINGRWDVHWTPRQMDPLVPHPTSNCYTCPRYFLQPCSHLHWRMSHSSSSATQLPWLRFCLHQRLHCLQRLLQTQRDFQQKSHPPLWSPGVVQTPELAHLGGTAVPSGPSFVAPLACVGPLSPTIPTVGGLVPAHPSLSASADRLGSRGGSRA